MLYELLFGYEGGCDEWTKAEGNDVRDVVIDFFRFIERTIIEGPARLYIRDNMTGAVYDPFYVSLRPGDNPISGLPKEVLKIGAAMRAI